MNQSRIKKWMGVAIASLFCVGAASAQISITLDEPLTRTYDGTPQTVTAITVPAGLAYQITYDDGSGPSEFAPTDVGEYDIYAVVVEPSYPNAETTGTLVVSPAALAVDGITAADKVYDGNTDATADFTAATLVGVVGADDVTLDSSAATAAFADKNVGVNKSVAVAGLVLGGADVANYELADPVFPVAPTAAITPAPLSVSGLTAKDRFYDGTVDVELQGTPVLDGVVAGDDVTVSGAATGTMLDKNAGFNKAVAPIVPGALVLGGADAGNYEITAIQPVPFDTVNIALAQVTVGGIIAESKQYDGTTAATINSVGIVPVGMVPGDDLTVVGTVDDGTFSQADIGTDLLVTPDPAQVAALTLGGADAVNYEINFGSEFGGMAALLYANITPFEAQIVPDAGQTKIYGQEDPTFTYTTIPAEAQAQFAGAMQRAPGEDVGAYDFNVGTLQSANYTAVMVAGAEQFTITPLTVAIIPDAGQTKVYGTVDPAFTFTSDMPEPLVADSPFAGALARAAGEDVGEYAFELGTLDAGANFTLVLADPANTFAVTPASLCVDGLSVQARAYNGGTGATILGLAAATLDPVVGADAVAIDPASTVLATFQDKNVGTGKAVDIDVSGVVLTGAQAGNYVVSRVCAPVTGEIFPKWIDVQGLTAENKVYDGTTAAVVAGGTLFGVIAGDEVALGGTAAVGQFVDPNVGTWDVLPDLTGLSLTGADAANYAIWTEWDVFAPFELQAQITAKELTVDGAVAQDKVYDGGTVATVDFTAAALVGAIVPDDVTLDGTGYTAAFSNKNVGDDKPVTVNGLALAGTQAGNYVLTQPVLAADIRPMELTVDGPAGGEFLASDKTYDGTTVAEMFVNNLFLVTPVAGDEVALVPVVAFDTKDVGINKPVSLTGASSLEGADAGNYTLSLVGAPSSLASIYPLELTVSGITVDDKVYNMGAAAVLNFDGAELVGVIGEEVVSLTTAGYTATFASVEVGTRYVTVAGLGLVGADSGNYTLTQPVLSGNIVPAPQTINFPAIGDQGILDTPALLADATSGLPVTFSVVSGPAYIDGGLLYFTAGGEVTVMASRTNNNNWAAAEDVVQSFMVDPDMTETVEVSQEWTVPDGVYEVNVQAWGGGGAGGGSENPTPQAYRGGAGGGGGAYASSILAVEPGQVLNLVVAPAQVGVQGENGPDGGSTYVGTDELSAVLLAAGGKGGQGNNAGGTPIGGAGGLAENCIGDTISSGAAGGNGATGIGESSGAGGNAAEYGVLLIDPEGAGGASRDDQGRGNDGELPGGGGGGSWSVDASRRGGDGAAGRIVMEYTVDLREPTTTVADDAAAIYGDESVELTATVTDTTPVNAESLFFTVTGPAGDVDTDPVAVVDGAAVATLDIIDWPAGDYPVVASYSGSVDFQPSVSEESTLTVAKADPVVDAWPTASAITYGQTLADSVLSDGVALVDGLFAFDAPATAPDAGTAAQAVTFTPDDAANYNAVASTVDVSVGKADPVVDAWPTASAIAFGQTLADSVLSDGAASVPGTFAFDAPATAPDAGTAAQAVTFTPADLANYNLVAGTVDVTVAKADPTVDAWPTASAIVFGQTLADSVLSGGAASVPGTFAFDAPATAPGAGTAAQAVTFTPDDAANYNTVAGTVDVTVNVADATVETWPTASALTYGQTLADSVLSGGAASVPGTFAFDDPALVPALGTTAQAVTFTPDDAANYNAVAGTVDVSVTKTAYDFDGDGMADLATFTPAGALWRILPSSGGEAVEEAFGWAAVLPVPGDYDNDGEADVAVYHPASGNWYLDQSTAGDEIVAWGWASAVPVPGDYDGDGATDIAVYHPATGNWYIRGSAGEDMTIAWGWAAAVPVPADYDGDGVTDIAVYHSATGNWYIEGMETIAHGWASAVPVAGDYNGDGRAEIAVFHRKSGNWYLRDWDTGATETFAWGWAAVVPVPADYDGDGVTDIAVYHPAGGTWYVAASSGEDMVEPLAGTRPVMLEALIHSWFGLP